MDVYDVGDKIKCQGTFMVSGTLTDPTTVTFKFRKPDGTIGTYVYGVDAEVVRASAGTFYVLLDIDSSGVWWVRFVGTGTAAGAVESSFDVRRSRVVGTGNATNTPNTYEVPVAVYDALVGAASPSGSNVYATREDIDAQVKASVGGGALAPNLMFDPIHATRPNVAVDWGGRTRWVLYGGSPAYVIDPDNPYSGYSLRLAGADSSCGKYVYLDESGTCPGNLFAAMLYGKCASGSFAFAIQWYSAAGVQLTYSQSTPLTFSGVARTLMLSGTIPASAAYGKCYLGRLSGTDPFYIYSIALVTDQKSIAERTPGVNVHLMRDWRSQLAKIRLGDGSSQAVVVLLGDSWVNNSEYITGPLRSVMQAVYGDAGVGWCSACSALGGSYPTTPTGVTFSSAGTWAGRDKTNALGPDIADVTSVDTGTPASQVVTASMRAIMIHYIKQANGGSFRYSVDGGGWTTVDTSNATVAHAMATISGLSDASHALTVEVTVAGVAGVTLLGYDIQRTGNGARVHKLGNPGAATGDYVAAPAAIWQAAITALAANACIILLGVNDMGANVTPATLRLNLETIATRIRTALPLCDVIFICPADIGVSGLTYSTGNYAEGMRASARENRYSFVDLFLEMGAYADANARGLMLNTSHINAAGGQVIADVIYSRLLNDRSG